MPAKALFQELSQRRDVELECDHGNKREHFGITTRGLCELLTALLVCQQVYDGFVAMNENDRADYYCELIADLGIELTDWLTENYEVI